MVFDLPDSPFIFDKRLVQLKSLVNAVDKPHLRLIKHFKVNNQQELKETLSQVVAKGGEGLMLHNGDSYYHGQRNNDLQKLKPIYDDEAKVIAYINGKGKYSGLMGALIVENKQGIRFKIGSGFKLKDRVAPPPIGSIITYKYRGLTKSGVPRFASFLRVRLKEE